MMTKVTLYYTNKLSWIFIVLADWNNCLSANRNRHVTPLWHIILISSQPVFVLTRYSKYCGEATNTQTNHHTNDVVSKTNHHTNDVVSKTNHHTNDVVSKTNHHTNDVVSKTNHHTNDVVSKTNHHTNDVVSKLDMFTTSKSRL